jgi:DnaJ-class molecular chaperone
VKDYYSILGVTKTASPDEIKRAYRRLASQHHPDKGGDTSKFQEIEEAYRTLGDPTRRAEYDNPRQNIHMNFGGPGFIFDDIFSMFGVHQQRTQRTPSARLTLWLTLEDIATGGPRLISVQQDNSVGNIEIDIPVGLDDGDTIRYPKMAPDGTDLVITYRVRPHDRWQRQGRDIVAEQSIEIWDLVLGCELPIKDLTGTELILRVPANTQPGSMLRLKGRGLPNSSLPGRQRHGPGGDLLIRVQARIPSVISQDLLAAIRIEKQR